MTIYQLINQLDPFTVGFEEFFNDLDTRTINYPPHNIYKVKDNHYCISIALAGFSKDDVIVELVENTLHVKSNVHEKDNKKLQHKGISTKDFDKSFKLASDIKVKGAELKDGLLLIDLIKDKPKVNKIKIK